VLQDVRIMVTTINTDRIRYMFFFICFFPP